MFDAHSKYKIGDIIFIEGHPKLKAFGAKPALFLLTGDNQSPTPQNKQWLPYMPIGTLIGYDDMNQWVGYKPNTALNDNVVSTARSPSRAYKMSFLIKKPDSDIYTHRAIQLVFGDKI
jgi:hypothetical protein